MTKRRSALLAATLLMLAPPATARELPPPVYPMATPTQFASALYTDISGILRGPGAVQAPLWWDHLAPRIRARHDRLRDLDARAGRRTFAFDWLCQCANVRRMHAQPRILVDALGDTSARLTVGLKYQGGETRTLTLLPVRQDGGWQLDDIVDDDGERYSAALDRAITAYATGRKPLPESRDQ